MPLNVTYKNQPPKMYIWRSDVCGNYSKGTVCVIADDIKTAKELAKKSLIYWLRTERHWIFDNDDKEDLNKAMATIEADLSAEPTIAGACVIAGSE